MSRFFKNRDGGASIEFVVVFPILFAVFAALIETGWLATRHIMIDRGLDMTARNLRLGYSTAVTHQSIKEEICDNATLIFNCDRDLVVELVPMVASDPYPQSQLLCRDRVNDVNPVLSFNPGARTNLMFIRACMVVDPLLPGIGLGLALPKDESGGYQMVSYTAFKNEP
ncbi:MAG: TadE/TadG family type IV pilus assembly protein [Pseudomonadota bacterium]